MHAPVLKRSPLNQWVWPALALAAIITISLTVARVDWSSDDGVALSGNQANVAPAQRSYAPSVNRVEAASEARANLALLAKEQRYYDAKMARMEKMEAAALYVPFVPAAYYVPNVGEVDIDEYVAGQTAASDPMTRADLDRLLGGY